MIVCGTGHRPNKLGGYGDAAYSRLVKLAMDYLKNTKHEAVISGMALGWDQALAEAAISLGIPVWAYVPFLHQEDRWPPASQDKYHELMTKATKVVYCSDQGYAAWKMQKRNERMVDDATYVLALWNGTSGGTGNCLGYAAKQKKQVVNLWDKYEQL